MATSSRQASAGQADEEGRGDRLARALAIYGLLVVGFALGLAFAIQRPWPYQPIVRSWYQVKDFWTHRDNDLGGIPSRHLVDAPAGRELFAVHAPDRASPGYRLFAGLIAERSSLNGVLMLDEGGREIHYWPVDYDLLSGEPGSSRMVFMHGLVVFEDGSIVVNFDQGDVVARLDACGEVIWSVRGPFHHALSRAHDGSLWTMRTANDGTESHSFVQLDANDGSVTREVSIVRDLLDGQRGQGVFGILHKELAPDKRGWHPDPFHPNDVEILSPELAPAFPMFAADDLLVSLRSLNLVAVLDGATNEIKWWQHGPWHRQHDPDFLPDGTIMVYDNNMDYGASRVLAVDPTTRATRTLYAGDDGESFYSRIRGRHQMLDNGNLLVAESERGRAFEVAPDGTIVLEYHNIFDDDRNGVLNDAVYLPADYFDAELPSCATS